jgi:hypothetical protein
VVLTAKSERIQWRPIQIAVHSSAITGSMGNLPPPVATDASWRSEMAYRLRGYVAICPDQTGPPVSDGLPAVLTVCSEPVSDSVRQGPVRHRMS